MSLINSILIDRFRLQEEYLGKDKLVNKLIPLVSVTISAYQHANFIQACLEGVLMQQTNFTYEIIIGEDGSVDGTIDLCKEYAEKYPDKIRLFLRDRKISQYYENNKFVCRFNGTWNRMSARGKYIAWCEGDDYWTDPFKLQKQVDFMEANPNFSMCFHDVEIKSEVGNMVKQFATPKSDILEFNDIIFHHYIPTCSLLYKRAFIPNPLPSWFINSIVGDIPLELFVAYKGSVKYFPEKMGVYRKHQGGITMDKERSKKVRMGYITLYRNLNAYFKYKYWVSFSLMILKHSLGMFKDRFIAVK